MRARGRFHSGTGLTRQLAVLATPLIFQQVSYTLLGVADTFFVSRLNTASLAAVGLAGVLFFTVLLLFRSTANSSVVFVGRAHGAGDDAAIGQWVWRCLGLVGLLSIASISLPWVLTGLFGLAAPVDNLQVRELGISYLRIRAIEVPMMMFSAVVWGFLLGRGDARTPMLLAWMTVGLNILLDWMFVLGNLGRAPARRSRCRLGYRHRQRGQRARQRRHPVVARQPPPLRHRQIPPAQLG